MSYCRWSSMNWMSDVYVYENVSGAWTTSVARRRRYIAPVPDILDGKLSMTIHKWSGAEWNQKTKGFDYPSKFRRVVYGAWSKFTAFWHNNIHMKSLDVIPMKEIGLDFDGMTFDDPTPTACADRLISLRKAGYRVPQYAIDALREENFSPIGQDHP